jgi:hypothetical protein
MLYQNFVYSAKRPGANALYYIIFHFIRLSGIDRADSPTALAPSLELPIPYAVSLRVIPTVSSFSILSPLSFSSNYER